MTLLKRALFSAALLLSTTATATATTSSDDKMGIVDTITAIAAGADRGDWARVRSAFATQVITDYTGLWGGEPTTQTANELMAAWSGFLPGFDTTHHMVTNHTITVLNEDSAHAEADFIATSY